MAEELVGKNECEGIMISYGIMQGRLTESKGRGIQFFPFDFWVEEFHIAEEIGLQEIEWIFDYTDYEANPLWTQAGCQKINELIGKTDINVHSVCFDYFMRRPFYKYSDKEKEAVRGENEHILEHVLNAMSLVGARLIEIPLVDDSSVKTEEEEKEVIDYIEKMARSAHKYGIRIGIESDYPPQKFRKFLEAIKEENVVSNYDSGNSSGLGYNHEEEIVTLNEYLYNLHIKDRVLGGTTMPLGTGSADFEKVFSALKKIGYRNSIILQAARGIEGSEKKTIENQLSFVKSYVKKYQLD